MPSITCVRVAASMVRSGCSGCAKLTTAHESASEQTMARRKITLEVVVLSIDGSPYRSKSVTKLFATEHAAQHQIGHVCCSLLDFFTRAQFSCAQAVRQQTVRRLQKRVRGGLVIVATTLTGFAA